MSRTAWAVGAAVVASGALAFVLLRTESPQGDAASLEREVARLSEENQNLRERIAALESVPADMREIARLEGAPPAPTAPAPGEIAPSAPADARKWVTALERLSTREAAEPKHAVVPTQEVPEVAMEPDTLAALAQDARATVARREWAIRALSVMDVKRTLQVVESLLGSEREEDLATADAGLRAADRKEYMPLLTRRVNDSRPKQNASSLLHSLARLKDRAWSAQQASGEPDTPFGGDLPTAWASKKSEMGLVWLVLEYAESVRPDEVRIHESFQPGAVAQIAAQDERADWVVLWEGRAEPGTAPRVFAPMLATVSFRTRVVRILVDTDRVEGWNEIDAVELVGDGRRQWADTARASSSYADP